MQEVEIPQNEVIKIEDIETAVEQFESIAPSQTPEEKLNGRRALRKLLISRQRVRVSVNPSRRHFIRKFVGKLPKRGTTKPIEHTFQKVELHNAIKKRELRKQIVDKILSQHGRFQ